jgi:hypothetical protein
MIRDIMVHEEYRSKGVKVLLNDIGKSLFSTATFHTQAEGLEQLLTRSGITEDVGITAATRLLVAIQLHNNK